MTESVIATEDRLVWEMLAEEMEGIGPTPDMAPEEIDVAVSRILRAITETAKDRRRYEAARDVERAHIDEFYRQKIEVHARLERELTVRAEQFAEAAKWGKVKSRRTPHGTYGTRTVPTKVEIDDEPGVVLWAQEHAPSLLRAKLTLSLPDLLARGFPTPPTTALEIAKRELTAHILSTGDCPYAAHVVHEHQQPYVKPTEAVDVEER
jgi:phage host-nuclease inhibitor protein Gam